MPVVIIINDKGMALFLLCSSLSLSLPLMDALAGYGSDSDASDAQQTGALAGLLGDYSDDDSHHDAPNATVEPPPKRSKCDTADANMLEDNIPEILPAPQLNINSSSVSPSLICFTKDYTVELRQKLSQQLATQVKEGLTDKQKSLNKLNQMRDTFHSKTSNDMTLKSFATHLKSQHQFHNPHLLKDIITHFEISPLQSNAGNTFARFEYVDRLVGGEERSRVAAAEFGG
jgi:hypothetical protein